MIIANFTASRLATSLAESELHCEQTRNFTCFTLFGEYYFFNTVKYDRSFGHGIDGEDVGLVFIDPVVVLYVFGSQFFVEKFGVGVENVVSTRDYRDFP